MKTLVVMLCALWFMAAAEAAQKRKEEPAPPPSHLITGTEPSEFKIERSLLDNLYNSQVTDVRVETRYRTGALEVIPQVSYLVPSALDLSNNYFLVPYASSKASFPFLQLTLASPISVWRYLEAHGELGVGYAFREAVYNVESKSGMKLKDMIALHWIPVHAGLRFTGRVPGFSYLKPSIGLGAGMQWLQQSGRLDGINQSFWVPFYRLTGALTLFDLTETGEHWFGGVTLGGTLGRSVGSGQDIRSLAWNLGITLVL